jgi:serine/threonine protein kinase
MQPRCPNCFRIGDADGACPECGWSSDSQPAADALAPGSRLEDARLVGGLLRRTPKSLIYRGWDERLELAVAIDEYFPEGLARRGEDGAVGPASEEAAEALSSGRSLFLDVSRRLVRLPSVSGIAAVVEFREDAGTIYRVGRLLDGIWLEDFLARRGGLTREPTLRILKPVIEALEAAHGAGLTHGALSPASVMLCRSGEVKLLDFSGDGTPADDIRALAGLFYRTLTGKPAPANPANLLVRSGEGLTPPPDGMDELQSHEREALFRALGAGSEAAFETVAAFRQALDGPPPGPPSVIPGSATPEPEPPPKIEEPQPTEPADVDKTRLLEPIAETVVEPVDALKTRLLGPTDPNNTITRLLDEEFRQSARTMRAAPDQTPTAIVTDRPPSTGRAAVPPSPKHDPNPPLSPLFKVAVALLGLLALVALIWLPIRYLIPSSDESQTEVAPPSQEQQQEQAEQVDPPPPEPNPAPPQEQEPIPSPAPEPPSYGVTPSPEPAPMPYPRTEPAPQPPAGLDASLAGTWNARLQANGRNYDCLFRIEGSGEYFLSAECPEVLSREQGRLQASNGLWIMQSANRGVQRGSYGFEGPALRWSYDNGPSLLWTRGAPAREPSQPEAPEQRYSRLVQEGARDAATGNASAAMQKLEEAVRLQPANPAAHAEMFSVAVNRTRNYSHAYDEGEQAIRYGGEIAFAVIRDGDWVPGTLILSKKVVSFRPDNGSGGFTVAPRDIEEIARNKGLMRNLIKTVNPQRGRFENGASFRVRTKGGRYNFAPRSGSQEEAELVVRLSGALPR